MLDQLQRNDMVRFLIISLCSLIIVSTQASPSALKSNKSFDNYVEGAMTVYSQFKRPSKDQSEEFYKFIKGKWVYTVCSSDCSKEGAKNAYKYVEIKNVETIKRINK